MGEEKPKGGWKIKEQKTREIQTERKRKGESEKRELTHTQKKKEKKL